MLALDATSLRVWCQFHGMEVRLPAGDCTLLITTQGILGLECDGSCHRVTEAELQELLEGAAEDLAVAVCKEAIGRPETWTLRELAATVARARRE